MRIGIYNCGGRHLAHEPADVAAWLDKAADRLDLDGYALSEACRYGPALERLDEWRLLQHHQPKDACDSALLLRSRIPARAGRSITMRLRWWGARHKLWRAPRTMASWRVDWLRLLAVHLPPGGPEARNRRAYAEQARRIVAYIRLRRRLASRVPIVALGDWNAAARNTAPYAPRWIAGQVNGDLRMSGIDGVISVGAQVTSLTVHDAPLTDHELVVVELEPLRGPRRIRNPIPGHPVTYPYGIRDAAYQAGHHTGEDHAAAIGTPCVAVTAGRVVEVSTAGGTWGAAYGTLVVIETTDRDRIYRYGYCHLSRTLVRVGQTVRPGDRIGLSGATGNVTGPHLHFEARAFPYRYGDDIRPLLVKKAPTT